MKRFKYAYGFQIALLAALAANGAYADKGSGSGSHGGIVSICPDGAGAEKVELVDLHETQLRDGLAPLAYAESLAPVDLQIRGIGGQLEKAFPGPNGFGRKEIIERALELRSAAKPATQYAWPEATDLNGYPDEPGCRTHTTVHYLSRNVVEYDESTFVRLSRTHQAALWVHEAVFELQRETARRMERRLLAHQFEERMASRPARRMVAYLFSSYQNPELFRSMAWTYLMDEFSTFGLRTAVNLVFVQDRASLSGPWYILGENLGLVDGTGGYSARRRSGVPGYGRKTPGVFVPTSVLGRYAFAFGYVSQFPNGCKEVVSKTLHIVNSRGETLFQERHDYDMGLPGGGKFSYSVELRPILQSEVDDFLAGLVH